MIPIRLKMIYHGSINAIPGKNLTNKIIELVLDLFPLAIAYAAGNPSINPSRVEANATMKLLIIGLIKLYLENTVEKFPK